MSTGELEGSVWALRDVVGCSACGEDHPITFQLLRFPIEGWTHVGICLNTGEPVWMKETDQ